MKLLDLFTQEELDAQLAVKMVKATSHPQLSLVIYNYTQMAAFTPELWNHVTDKCRGLIADDEGNLVARGFEKFWNLNDTRHPETLMENLPSAPPTLTRKMDGSLGIGYRTPDGWAIATRGSFSSEQALWATAWLRRCAWANIDFGPDMTPLFEIIYPENQIVVNYRGHAGLTLLAVVNNVTGEELDYPDMAVRAYDQGITVVDRFDKKIVECAAEDDPNEEGYVAAWPRPGRTPLRVKIKYETYVKLHRLLTQTNAVTVWEMLRDGLDVQELTVDVPAEFREWIDGLEKRFHDDYKAIEDGALAAMLAYPGEKNITDKETKKAFAIYVTSRHPKVASIMFAIVDGKNYAPIIWKMIRPRGDERAFKVDADG